MLRPYYKTACGVYHAGFLVSSMNQHIVFFWNFEYQELVVVLTISDRFGIFMN